MTEKQYKLQKWTDTSLYYSFPKGNVHQSIGYVINKVENDLNQLADENEHLKKTITATDELLKHQWKENKMLRNSLNQLQTLADKYHFQIEDTPDILEEYILVDNEIIHQKNIENMIKEAIQTERTQLGQSVLKQLLEAIQ